MRFYQFVLFILLSLLLSSFSFAQSEDISVEPIEEDAQVVKPAPEPSVSIPEPPQASVAPQPPPASAPLPTPETQATVAPPPAPTQVEPSTPTSTPSPSQNSTVTSAVTSAPEPTPPPEPTVKVPETKSNIDTAILEHPTQNLEAYEKERLKFLIHQEVPDWSINFRVAWRSFSNADLRVTSDPEKTAVDVKKPKLTGLLFSFERFLFTGGAGNLSLGVETGTYGSPPKDRFDNLTLSFLSVGPYITYQAHYVPRQWVVPVGSFEYDVVRYSYVFREGPVLKDRKIRGVHPLRRVDLGLLFFLNILDVASSGDLKADFGVKRTYLAATYSIAQDTKKKDFDLSERTYRVGFRFEF